MDERALYGEARRMLEERHDQKRALLAEIAGAKGWREDPLSRHPWRWYDGAQWTARVHGQRPDGTEGEFIDEESADIFADDEVVRQGLAAQREATERAAREEQQAAQQTVTGGYSDT
jgi:hypothetical protein